MSLKHAPKCPESFPPVGEDTEDEEKEFTREEEEKEEDEEEDEELDARCRRTSVANMGAIFPGRYRTPSTEDYFPHTCILPLPLAGTLHNPTASSGDPFQRGMRRLRRASIGDVLYASDRNAHQVHMALTNNVIEAREQPQQQRANEELQAHNERRGEYLKTLFACVACVAEARAVETAVAADAVVASAKKRKFVVRDNHDHA